MILCSIQGEICESASTNTLGSIYPSQTAVVHVHSPVTAWRDLVIVTVVDLLS